jgi:GDP-4-dehydro-6-deoxy-D-mannose reductase
VHLRGTLNVARAILEYAPDCMLIYVGSAMVYGPTANHVCPLSEAAVLAPIDEYSASKAAADLAVGALASQGLKAVRMRPFNHIGPGQSESFFVPSMAMQLARIATDKVKPILRVGNLDSERDYLDVRDVARAYALVAARSAELKSGLILNIASGQPRRSIDLLQLLIAKSGVQVSIEQDPFRMRRSEIPRMVGDASRAHAVLGWSPRFSFEDTLQRILDGCGANLKK